VVVVAALPDDAGYLYRYLPYHLSQAGGSDKMADLVCLWPALDRG
jgi:hypothetical protein